MFYTSRRTVKQNPLTRNSVVQNEGHGTADKHGRGQENVQHLVDLHDSYAGVKERQEGVITPRNSKKNSNKFKGWSVRVPTSDERVSPEVVGENQTEEDGEAKDEEVT